MKKYIKVENILFVIYMIVTFLVVLNHEPWRDEAQAWLIVKDLNLLGIFKQLRYEGHPFLYYMIIMPFVKIGFSYKSVNIISWIFGMCSAFLLIKKSPYNLITKIVVLFSPIFLYYCSVLGRSYCLVLFLVVVLSIIYKNRDNYSFLYGVILLLLANTHILMLGFVLALICVDLYEILWHRDVLTESRKNRKISILISILGVLVLSFQLFGSIGLNSEVNFASNIASPIVSFLFCYCLIWYGILSLYFVLLCSFVIFKDKKLFFILICGLGFQLFVFLFLYEASPYMISLIFIIYIFCSWIFLENTFINLNDVKKINKCILCIFLVQIFLSFDLAQKDIRNDFSDSYNAALFLKENIDSTNNILCTDDARCSAIIPYLTDDYRFISVFDDKYFRYVTWSRKRTNKVSLTSKFDELDINYVIHSYDVDNKIDSQINFLKKNNKIVCLYKSEKSVITSDKYEIFQVVKE